MSTSESFQQTKDSVVRDESTGLELDFVAYCRVQEEKGDDGPFTPQKERVNTLICNSILDILDVLADQDPNDDDDDDDSQSVLRILDIGCAIGTDLRKWLGTLQEQQPQIFSNNNPTTPKLDFHGIDIMPAMIAAAEDMSPEMQFQVGNIHELPYDDNFFHVVHCSRVLFHSSTPEEALQEMTRVLAPGGRCFAVEGDIDSSIVMTQKDVIRRVEQLRSEQMKKSTANPYAARNAFWTLKQWEQYEPLRKITNVQMESVSVTVTDALELDFGLKRASQSIGALVTQERVTEDEANAYIKLLRASKETGDPIVTIVLHIISWSKTE